MTKLIVHSSDTAATVGAAFTRAWPPLRLWLFRSDHHYNRGNPSNALLASTDVMDGESDHELTIHGGMSPHEVLRAFEQAFQIAAEVMQPVGTITYETCTSGTLDELVDGPGFR